MDEKDFSTGLEGSEPQPLAGNIKTLCKDSPQDWEWLGTLFEKSLWGLRGLARTLADLEDDRFVPPLVTLIDGVEHDLAILEQVLAETFGGRLKVETPGLEIVGLFHRRHFGQVFIDPPKAQAKAAA
jgi:hypothetical protein